jgi:hypothetical protein
MTDLVERQEPETGLESESSQAATAARHFSRRARGGG